MDTGPETLAEDAALPACRSTAECDAGEACLFPVGDCNAKGQCLSPSSLGPVCHLAVSYCGCSGQDVTGICGPPYAAAPTLGISAPCGPAVRVASGLELISLAEQGWRALPAFVAVDSVSVYWTNAGLGSVMKVARCGGVPITLASGLAKPEGVAVDATDVYFALEGDGTGAIAKVGLDGGVVTTLASTGVPYAIAVDEQSVYWTDVGNAPGVLRLPIHGGAPSRLASGNAWAITVDATAVYWTGGGSVLRASKTGGAPATLASGQSFPYDLAVDTRNVYWTDYSAGRVMTIPLSGGAPTTLSSAMMPEGIVVDDSTVYWTSNVSGNAGTVSSVPKGGGSASTLVTGQSTPQGLAADPPGIYWVDTGRGTVMRLGPK